MRRKVIFAICVIFSLGLMFCGCNTTDRGSSENQPVSVSSPLTESSENSDGSGHSSTSTEIDASVSNHKTKVSSEQTSEQKKNSSVAGSEKDYGSEDSEQGVSSDVDLSLEIKDESQDTDSTSKNSSVNWDDDAVWGPKG